VATRQRITSKRQARTGQCISAYSRFRPREGAERIVIRLTQGGLKNYYVSLANHLDFFPAAAIGGPGRGKRAAHPALRGALRDGRDRHHRQA
jgi:hypothetical protein